MHAVRITRAIGRTGRVMGSSGWTAGSVAASGRPSGLERVLLEYLRRDHHLLNLGRAFVDLADAGVAPVALDAELGQITVASVYLDGPVGAAGAGLGSVPLGQRGFLDVGSPLVAQPRRLVGEQPRRVDLDRGVRQHLADGVELADRPVECPAL